MKDKDVVIMSVNSPNDVKSDEAQRGGRSDKPKVGHNIRRKVKWTKTNPHPDFLKDPTAYTYQGKPRCQYIRSNGKQCAQAATIGDFCSMHCGAQERLARKEMGDPRQSNYKFLRVKDDLVRALRQGYTISTAAVKCGVKARTVTDWRNRGKLDIVEGKFDTDYAKFYEDSEDARLYACSLVENALFSAAMGGNVSAMIRYLECRMPDVWNAKRVMEINTNTTHQLQVSASIDVSGASDEQLRENIRKIAEAMCMTTDSVGVLRTQTALNQPIPVDAEVVSEGSANA